MISKTKIGKRVRRKTNSEIVETILILKKNKAWLKLARIISGSTRKYSSVNLDKINKETKEGDTIVIPGKVLGSGNLDKKIRIAALGFSEKARKKLKEVKAEAISLIEEVKKNPEAKGIKNISW